MLQANHDLYQERFPRSNVYDPEWVKKNQMGPNALWLAEWLCEKITIKPEMRVLDLGCGKAMSSIFLAREFGARVWAADLWISAEENWRRVNEAGVSDRVFPLRIEAHALPFPREFFDAVVSLDSYDYYGTDDLYLSYLSCFARPGAEIGVVVPGLMQPIGESVPEHLTRKQDNGYSFWHDDCIRFHTADWWGAHWRRSNCLEAVAADTLPDGWKLWRDFEVVIEKAGTNPFPSAAQTLAWDGGRYVGFVRVAGRRKEGINPINLYDAGIISSLGLDMEG